MGFLTGADFKLQGELTGLVAMALSPTTCQCQAPSPKRSPSSVLSFNALRGPHREGHVICRSLGGSGSPEKRRGLSKVTRPEREGGKPLRAPEPRLPRPFDGPGGPSQRPAFSGLLRGLAALIRHFPRKSLWGGVWTCAQNH